MYRLELTVMLSGAYKARVRLAGIVSQLKPILSRTESERDLYFAVLA
jgi:hypothetical protein